MVGTHETGYELLALLEKNGYRKTRNLVNALLKTKALKRLKDISYLASIPYAFPEVKDFSRWDHSIGTANLLAQVLVRKEVSEEDLMRVVVTGLLHDVGNVFFSHVGEAVVRELLNLDQDKLRDQVVNSSELKEVLKRYEMDSRLVTYPPHKYRLLLDSHFDCDTLDGISRTARALSWQTTDWSSLLPSLLDIVDDKWVWNPIALPFLRAQWEQKKRVYDEYVYSSRNQACELMLEQMLHLLNIEDIWVAEKDVLSAAEIHPQASHILSKLKSGELYDLTQLDDEFQGNDSVRRFEMFRAGVFHRVLKGNRYAYLKSSRQKVFDDWSLVSDEPLLWREFENELKNLYHQKTRYLLGVSQSTESESIVLEGLEEFKDKSEIPIQFVSIFEQEGSKTYPLGVLTLATILERSLFSSLGYLEYTIQYCAKVNPKKPFDWFMPRPDPWKRAYSIYDNFSDYEQYFSVLQDAPVILIGPVFTCYLQELMFLASKIRQFRPDAIILTGGPHFGKDSEMDSELLSLCHSIDGFVIGEAEETIVDLMEVRVKDQSRESFIEAIKTEPIQGLLTRDSSYEPREEITDLDSIPLPDLDLLHSSSPFFVYSLSDRRNPYLMTHHGYIMDAYGGGSTADDMYLFGDPMRSTGHRERFDGQSFSLKIGFGVISGSRGCPFNCSFCASHGDRRIRSSQHVFKEMMLVHKHFNINLFVFFDPLFMTSNPQEKKRIEELCDLLLSSGLSDSIDFQIEIRADVILKLDDSLLVKMIHAGCKVMNLGLEKGSDNALSKIDKKMKLADHARATKKIRNAANRAGRDVLINGTFIMGGPDETPQDIKDTVIHAYNLDLDGLAIFPLEIHPATKDHEKALEKKVIKHGLKPYLKLKKYPLFHSKCVSRGMLTDLNMAMVNVFKELKIVRDEVNTLGTELQLTLPRFTEIAGHNASEDVDKLKVSDKYARWFLRLLKREIAKMWLSGKTAPSLADLPEVMREIELLESQLNKYRRQDYDYHTGDYRDGELTGACRHFLSSVVEFVKILGAW